MQIMVSADGNRPIEGSGHNAKPTGGKPEKRQRKTNQKTKQKPAQQSAAKFEPVPEAREPLPEVREPADVPVASTESPPAAVEAAETFPIAPAEPEAPAPVDVEAITEPVDRPAVSAESPPAAVEAAEISPVAPAEPEAPVPVSVQAITDAYGSYTRKSIEQTSSFFEQLAGTRTPNKAFELQMEFAQAAFDTFVDESRKIRELHRELAKQRWQNFEGFVMGRRAAR